MTVYIEYAIIDNMIMDYLLIKESAYLLKLKTNKWQMLAGAAIGTVGAIILPLFHMADNFLFLIKIVLGALVALVGVRHRSCRGYFKYFNVFLLATFITGGAIIGVLSIMGVEYALSAYENAGVLPVGVNILIAYLFALAVKKAVKRTAENFITEKYVYKCHLKKGNVIIKAKGYFDSGNKLKDDKTGLPVVLCSKKFLNKMIDMGATFRPPRRIEYSTVSQGGEVLLYEVDKILITTENGSRASDLLLGVMEKTPFKEDLLLGAFIF